MADERPPLLAVLEHYAVALRGSASNQMVSCPLHDDRTPSCSINLDRGLWNCKSCGKGGDSYTLIMEVEQTDFVGAKAVAASLGFATGSSGGGDGELSGSSYAGRRRVPPRKRDHRGRGKYVPAWKRP